MCGERVVTSKEVPFEMVQKIYHDLLWKKIKYGKLTTNGRNNERERKS